MHIYIYIYIDMIILYYIEDCEDLSSTIIGNQCCIPIKC